MAIAGKVAITPKGEWNAQTAYTKLDLVFYENASYVAIQPSTGVEPTNTSYWMLMVQSAGGADLEAIIDGTQQVGNAKTLDGHEAEYFVPLSELAKYFKNTGGAINGNVKVYTAEDTYRVFTLENGTRTLEFALYAGGAFRIQDITNGKNILLSTADGKVTVNGLSSENLPLTGGEVAKSSTVPLSVKNTNENETVLLRFANGTENIGHYGFDRLGNALIGSGNLTNYYKVLHTGNKPTGTYTGNGSATSRTISTGGIGSVVLIVGGGCSVIVTPSGAFGTNRNSEVMPNLHDNEIYFSNGEIHISTSSAIVNTSGVTYTWQVL